MYSPKIDETLIPHIYRAAKAANIPMTRWVNRAVESALPTEQTPKPVSLRVLDSAKPLAIEQLPSQARIEA